NPSDPQDAVNLCFLECGIAGTLIVGRMENTIGTHDLKLLLVNGECGRWCRCKIADLLRKSFDDYAICETKEFSNSDTPAPRLIILHSSITPRFRRLFAFVKQRCRAAPLVGVVCGAAIASREVFETLVPDMDDFLFCPVGEVELILRLRRLLRPEDDQSRSTLSREIKEKYQ